MTSQRDSARSFGMWKKLPRKLLAGLMVVTTLNGLRTALAMEATTETPRILPRPRVEEYRGRWVVLCEAGETLKIASTEDRECPPAVGEGIALFNKRIKVLGCEGARWAGSKNDSAVRIETISPDALATMLDAGNRERLEGQRLEQAYALECGPAKSKGAAVVIRGSTPLGHYYGLVSLCQLVEKNPGGGVRAPEVVVRDWPAIGIRLAKTSGTHNPLPVVQRYAAWLPLNKMSAMGIQFHGKNSKELGRFRKNVEVTCAKAQREGNLETIVYFCPFRGKAYDFEAAEDRQAYVDLIHWILDQGAHGIEVDYNDWPGEKTPIEDVINLACDAVNEKRPDAYVLYCPPNTGPSQYRGEATPEMTQILSQVPPKVWPLWTGMATLITKPLTAKQVEQWTKDAGRRPFLWVNRVSLGVERAFSRPVEQGSDTHVFQGELLPKDLDRLFEGIHFNAGFSRDYNELPQDFSAASLAYFSTAADYVWNPDDWEAAESVRRAKRFVEIMKPLIQE
ncbi:MAG: beta-N-acetylglucosaminidase domain-containing protein [Candidatus Hydrogenedentota bacterium]